MQNMTIIIQIFMKLNFSAPIYDYPTLKRREKLATTVDEWLRYNLVKYTVQHKYIHIGES